MLHPCSEDRSSNPGPCPCTVNISLIIEAVTNSVSLPAKNPRGRDGHCGKLYCKIAGKLDKGIYPQLLKIFTQKMKMLEKADRIQGHSYSSNVYNGT